MNNENTEILVHTIDHAENECNQSVVCMGGGFEGGLECVDSGREGVTVNV